MPVILQVKVMFYFFQKSNYFSSHSNNFTGAFSYVCSTNDLCILTTLSHKIVKTYLCQDLIKLKVFTASLIHSQCCKAILLYFILKTENNLEMIDFLTILIFQSMNMVYLTMQLYFFNFFLQCFQVFSVQVLHILNFSSNI